MRPALQRNSTSHFPSKETVANDPKKQPQSWNSLSSYILLVVSILAVLPVWIPTYPPMSDLPQHAAQVALLRELQNPSFAYASFFRLNWFTPYLFGYLLIYTFAPLVGIVAACKLAVSLYIAGFPLSTGLLLRSVDVDVFWAILCIPGAYGFAYQWGFLNFLIAAPVGILFLWLVLRLSSTPWVLTSVLLAGSAIALFFCHALICAFFGACAVFCLLAGKQPFKATLLRILPLSLVLPVAALWMRRTLSNPVARKPVIWDLNWHRTVEAYYGSLSQELHLTGANWGRLTGFFPRLFGTTPSWGYVLVGIVLFVLPLCAGLRPSRQSMRWMPFLLCVAVLLWCPHAVFGTEFVYQRFTMFIVPLFLFLLDEPSISPKTATSSRIVALILVAGLIASASVRAIKFSRQTRGFQEALRQMQPGQRVLSLAFDHGDSVSIAPTFLHFPQWYAAQKHGVVDPSAAMMHPELVVYRQGETPEAVLWDFEWDPEEFDWDDYSGEQYRYFVVRSEMDEGPILFSKASCTVSLRFHRDNWWLYERAADCPTSTASVTRSSR